MPRCLSLDNPDHRVLASVPMRCCIAKAAVASRYQQQGERCVSAVVVGLTCSLVSEFRRALQIQIRNMGSH